MFATNLPIVDIDAADEVFCWGRRRWNIENVFKEQKRVEVGLKHRFVNRTDANRVWYCLMMMAWTIWQMFQRGFREDVAVKPGLPRRSRGGGGLRQNAGTRLPGRAKPSKMAHGGGVSRRRAPFLEYLVGRLGG